MIKNYRMLGATLVLCLGGALLSAGCNDETAIDGGGGQGGQGGGGGQGGDSTGSGGTAPGCDPTFAVGGQGGQGGADASETIAIVGTYSDGYGGKIVIDATSLQAFSDVFTFTKVDNEHGVAVAHNGATNAFNPGLYSRFVWTFSGTALYYCQSPYDAETAEEAESADLPDASDLTKGCDGFPWSRLSVPCEISE